MGRYWNWGGKSSRREREEKGRILVGTDSTTSTDCMCAVFQFFDFHQLQIPLNHQQQSFNPHISPSKIDVIPEGVEAPRNNLKSEGEGFSLSSIIDEENNLNIPMGIQIKTSRGTKSTDSSETSSSPATKTPTLVARLMGLDETNSPTFNCSTYKTNPSPLSKSYSKQRVRNRRKPPQSKPWNFTDNDIGTHSLPKTPRISSARRSDVDHHHRLSLQINKENVISNASEDLDFSRLLSIRRKFDAKEQKIEDESRSSSHYARQIVKHVKEKVSRKVGLDITNTVRNRVLNGELNRNELVYQPKSKKTSNFFLKDADESTPGKQSTISSNKSNKPSSSMLSTYIKDQNFNVQTHQTIEVIAKPKQQPQQEQKKQQQKNQLTSTHKCRKIASARDGFGPRPKKQEKTVVRPSTAIRANSSDKKCKKTPLSNNLPNINVPTLLLFKKNPSPQPTKIPHTLKFSLFTFCFIFGMLKAEAF